MKIKAVIFALSALFSFTFCTKKEEKAAEPVPVKSDLTDEAYRWADSVARSLPLEKQAAQLIMPAVFARSDEPTLRRISEYAEMNVGGLVLLKGDVKAITTISDTLHDISRRDSLIQPMFLALDAEKGLNMRLKDAPAFPWNSLVNDSVSEQVFFDYGAEIGREAELVGINMILGPVVDIERSFEGKSIMKLRSLGFDKERVAGLGEAYAKGLESMNVISVAKHFPGHGPTSVDTHKGLAYISKDRTELETIDMYPFKTLSDNATTGLMVGHIWAEALDSVKRPASFSPIVIKEILKKEIGFKGLVIVDALGMGGAKGFTSADAIAAGADIILAPIKTSEEIANIVEGVESGKISRDEVLDRCRRVLFYKYLFNIPNARRSSHGMTYEQVIEDLFSKVGPIIKELN